MSSLPTVNGITPKAGDVKYVDTNNDHRIDGNDRQVLGSIQPDFTYGLSSQLQWGAFDAQVVFAGSHGAKALQRARTPVGADGRLLQRAHHRARLMDG